MEISIRKDIPIEKVELDIFRGKKIEVYIQRDDLLHKDVSGNKWRKLKYTLKEYDSDRFDGILTFGGAFSNHLAATAAACKLLNIPFTAIIRGDKPKELNSTLAFLINQNSTLEWVSRSEYRKLRDENWPNPNSDLYRNYLVIPEGGYSDLAIQSCMEISKFWNQSFNFACCSIGTGTTFSGMVNGLKQTDTRSIGFVMLKDKEYLTKEILDMTNSENYILNREYHFNGFAKVTDELVDFLNEFYDQTNIPLDPVYTGKMMFGICDLAKRDFFPESSKIIAIHTGGLQGILGCNMVRAKKGKTTLKYGV